MTVPDNTDASNQRDFDHIVSLVVIGVLTLAVTFNLVLLFPEVTGGVFPFNDSVFHLLLAEMAADAISHGKDFTDPWQGTMSLGFPMFHYYPHLPHLTIALANILTFEVFPVSAMMKWSVYLLLSLFPLSLYWALRRFGFEQLVAAMGAFLAPLIATNYLYGFGYTSYAFFGYGLYAQLWAMVLLPPALAAGYRVLREGQGYLSATLLLAATLMSHLLYGYMAFISLGVLTFIQLTRWPDLTFIRSAMWAQWFRLIILFLLVVVVTSYFLVPFLLDREYFNVSVHEGLEKYDSFGHAIVLQTLIEGDLFDFRRFPSLTILVVAGLGVCLIRWRDERYLIPLMIFLLWLLLYFGRPTWGPLMDLLPLNRELHMHRFIGGIHIGGICLAAVALAVPLRWSVSRGRLLYVGMALLAILILMLPVYVERKSYLSENAFFIEKNREAMVAEGPDLIALSERLKQLPPGRVYAGNPAADHWGSHYRVGYAHVYAVLHAEGLDMVGSMYHKYSLPSDVLSFFVDENSWEQYNLFNVRYVVAPEGQRFPNFVKPVQQFGRHHLFQVETTGYFDLVGSETAFVGGRADFYPAASSWLRSDLLKVKQHPAVSMDGSAQKVEGTLPLRTAPKVISKVAVSDNPSRGKILSEEVGPNFYEVDVDAERKSMLLLKSTYHPNWHAIVDNVQVDTVMLMPGFVGVQLTPGSHTVRMEYRSGALRKILLGIGALTLVFVAVWEKSEHGFFGRSIARVSIGIPRLGKNSQSARSRRRWKG